LTISVFRGILNIVIMCKYLILKEVKSMKVTVTANELFFINSIRMGLTKKELKDPKTKGRSVE